MELIRILIIKEWTQVFLKTFLGLYLLISNANIISELSRGMVTFDLILIHHFLDTPRWLLKIIPVSCLMATLFSLNNLRSKNELVAIFAAGFPLKNFVLTLFQLSTIIALIQFILGGYLDPFARKMRPVLMKGQEIHFRVAKSSGVRTSFAGDRLWYKGKDYFASFHAFNKVSNTLLQVSFYFFNEEFSKLRKVLSADSATHVEGLKWRLENARVLPDLSKPNFTKLEKNDQLDLFLGEEPADFKYLESDISRLNVVQLYQYIKSVERLGIQVNEYSVLLYNIFAGALLCILFTLTPIFALEKPNRRGASFGKNVFFTLVFVVLFWLSYSVLLNFGNQGKLIPLVAVFIIPALLGLLILLKIRKLDVLGK